LSKIIGLPGKPNGIDGSKVGQYFREGKIREIADYCETDIVNTYRVWLRYELFRGKLTPIQYQFSEQKLGQFIVAREKTKPHLNESRNSTDDLLAAFSCPASVVSQLRMGSH
jgi:predicted PolB exonuclease-like 3'-5' exonuclease